MERLSYIARAEGRLALTGAPAGFDAYLAAEAAQRRRGLVLFVAADDMAAQGAVEAVAFFVVRPMALFQWVFGIPINLLKGLGNLVLRLIGLRPVGGVLLRPLRAGQAPSLVPRLRRRPQSRPPRRGG